MTIHHQVLVELEAREPNRHLGDNTRCYSSQTLIESQRRFSLYDSQAYTYERRAGALFGPKRKEYRRELA